MIMISPNSPKDNSGRSSKVPEAILVSDEEIQQAAARELARRYLIDFTLATHRDYVVNWHHRMIADALMRLLRREITRLMIFTPPRHGKSELASVKFPAFAVGRNPDENVIATSYGDELAQTFGGQARDIVMSPVFSAIFPDVRISPSSTAKTRWMLERKIDRRWERAGGYVGSGVGGPITGKGATIGIIDDPIKNQEEAESETFRKRVWDWYRSTFYTRLEKDAVVLIMMTRWHGDDLAGRLLEEQRKGGDKWEVLRLPAIAEQSCKERKKGFALWPLKYDNAALHRIRRNVGTRVWDALYQQNPTQEEGNLFKRQWWRFTPHAPSIPWITIHSWDTAWEKTDASAYTSQQTWVKDGSGFYCTKRRRWKIRYPEIKQRMKDLYKEEKPDGVLVEYKASGIAAVQELQRDGDVPVIPWPREGENLGSKLVRAIANSPMIESGLVHIVGHKEDEDVEAYIKEHAEFPNGKYKDQVDCTSQALSYLKDAAGVATMMGLTGTEMGIKRKETGGALESGQNGLLESNYGTGGFLEEE